MKSTKRILSIFLVMLVLLMSIPFTAQSAVTVTSGSVNKWPGRTMEMYYVTKNIYYFDIPLEYNNFIFSDGNYYYGHNDGIAYQTEDIKFVGGDYLYTPNLSDTDYVYGATICSVNSTKYYQGNYSRRVYFKAPSYWEKPSCYCWASTGYVPPEKDEQIIGEVNEWPGQSMGIYDYLNNIYYFDIPYKYNYFIFSDGNYYYGHDDGIAFQTQDIQFTVPNRLYIPNLNDTSYVYGATICSVNSSRYDVGNYSRRVYFKAPSHWETPSCYCWSQSLPTTSRPQSSGNATNISGITLNEGLKVQVPDDIPGIGNAELEIDFSYVDISVVVEDNKIRMGIGCKDVSEIGDEEWRSYKNYVEGYQENINKGKKLLEASKKGEAKTGLDKNFDVSVYGYYEGTFKNGVCESGNGLVNIKVTGEAGTEWQLPIPIVVKIKGYAGVDAKVGIDVDWAQKQVNFDNEVGFVIPGIYISGGVGLAYVVDFSAYGKGEHVITFKNNPKAVTCAMQGELGVAAKFLFWEGHCSLWDGKWEYYNSANKSIASTGASMSKSYLDENIFVINRSYLENQSSWIGNKYSKVIAPLGAGLVYDTLQSSVYNNADAQIIRAGDITMMVWTADIPERTTGNHTAIVYSLYENGIWTEPTIIDDDGTSDSSPNVATDGESIYVAWTDANRTFDENAEISEVASSLEICISKFDVVNKRFTITKTLTNDTVFDTSPVISVKDSLATVAWKNNSKNSVFEFDGTDSIYYAVVDENGDYTVNEFASVNEPVFEISTDSHNIAYTKATKSKGYTPNDIELYYGVIGESPTRITENTTAEISLKHSVIDGVDYLTYLLNGAIHGIDQKGNNVLLTNENVNISKEYQFVTNDNITKLVSVEPTDNASDIYSYSLVDGLWSNPVQLTESDAYLNDVNAIIDSNDDLKFIYLRTKVEFTKDNLIETSDLCVSVIKDKHDLTLNSVEYISDNVVPGGELDITLNITNNGTYDENGLHLTVVDRYKNKVLDTVVDINLLKGETQNIKAKLSLPKEITSVVDYSVSVTPAKESDVKVSDNTKAINLGYTDLQLDTDVVNNGVDAGVYITVKNNSSIASSAILQIKNNDVSETINEYYLEEVQGKSEKTYLLDFMEIYQYTNDLDTICVEVIASKEENALADNIALEYIGDLESFGLGDTNQDSVVSIIDATEIQRNIACIIINTDVQNILGDVNKDGVVSIMDATCIQMLLAGYISDFLEIQV